MPDNLGSEARCSVRRYLWRWRIRVVSADAIVEESSELSCIRQGFLYSFNLNRQSVLMIQRFCLQKLEITART